MRVRSMCRRTACNFRPAASTISPTCCGRARSAACSSATAWSRWSHRSSATARPVFRDLRWGVYVVLKAPNDYAAACFKQYGLPTDDTGRYAAMYKPFHLIGLELSISVLNAALRGEANRCDARMARRRCYRRQARAQGRRDARRRGRLHRLRQACSGRAQSRRAGAAARSRPQGAAYQRHRGRRFGALERCCNGCRHARGADAPRGRSDGTGEGRVTTRLPSAPSRDRVRAWAPDTDMGRAARTRGT